MTKLYRHNAPELSIYGVFEPVGLNFNGLKTEKEFDLKMRANGFARVYLGIGPHAYVKCYKKKSEGVIA